MNEVISTSHTLNCLAKETNLVMEITIKEITQGINILDNSKNLVKLYARQGVILALIMFVETPIWFTKIIDAQYKKCNYILENKHEYLEEQILEAEAVIELFEQLNLSS